MTIKELKIVVDRMYNGGCGDNFVFANEFSENNVDAIYGYEIDEENDLVLKF